MLVFPFVASLLASLPVSKRWLVMLFIEHDVLGSIGANLLVLVMPLWILFLILARVRQWLLLCIVGSWLFQPTLVFIYRFFAGGDSSFLDGFGGTIVSFIGFFGIPHIIGVALFAAVYSRRCYGRVVPFVLLGFTVPLVYPLSATGWAREIAALGLLVVNDLLVVNGAALLVWGVVRLKETDRLPRPALVIFLLHFIVFNVTNRALEVFSSLDIRPLELVLTAGILIAMALVSVGLALLAIAVLNRIEGRPSPVIPQQ